MSKSPTATATKWAALWATAAAAGKAAGDAATPDPILVTTADGAKTWYVPDGLCGFAWVKVTPGTSSFARWLVKSGLAHKGYGGGVDIWVSDFGQSIDRKTAAARAIAKVLTDAGITAYAQSRLD